jgi:hypothetical protein
VTSKNFNKLHEKTIAESRVMKFEGSRAILNVSADATSQQISKAYREMASVLHPDKNNSPNSGFIFDKLTNAYEELKRTESKPLLLLHPYHNHRTFVNLENSLSISKDDLIVLDGYAFSITELCENANANLKDFYRNPHIIQAGENTSFSENAIKQLRMHPILSQYAKVLDEKLALQKNGISEKTIDEVIFLLKKIENGLAAADKAEVEFGRYFFTLSAEEQTKLNAYLIRVESTYGGFQNLTFEAALMGGNSQDRCTQTLKIYLWQFVVDFRPAEFQNIPRNVMRMASLHYLKIKLRESYAPSISLEEKPDGGAPVSDSLLAGLAEIFFGSRQEQVLPRVSREGDSISTPFLLSRMNDSIVRASDSSRSSPDADLFSQVLSASDSAVDDGNSSDSSDSGDEDEERNESSSLSEELSRQVRSAFSSAVSDFPNLVPGSLSLFAGRGVSVSNEPGLRTMRFFAPVNSVSPAAAANSALPFLSLLGLQGAVRAIRQTLPVGTAVNASINGQPLNAMENQILASMLNSDEEDDIAAFISRFTR